MQPLVSILIPAFNAEAWIADTIESALGQTWPRTEIIVVDDGSTDQTLAVARKFSAKGVTVVSQSNQGAAATRNRAYSLCQGDYIQWLDADDVLNPEKVASQMEAGARGGSDRTLLSSGWAFFTYRPRRAKFIPTALWSDMSPVEWMTRKMEGNLHMQTATWLVSRKLTDAAGPWNTQLLGDDDGEYFARVLMAGDAVKFVPDARVYYRVSPSSRLSYIGRSDRKMEAQLHSMRLNVGYIRSLEDSPRVRAACVKYLYVWSREFYPYRPDLIAQARQMAESLGGTLPEPTLSWKFAWLGKLFGDRAAKRVQMDYNVWKSALLRLGDKSLHAIEKTFGQS